MATIDVKNAEDSASIKGSASGSQSNSSAKNQSQSFEINTRPVCLIVLGMAGSGKTSFVRRLTQLGNLQNMKPYVVNLDPACREVPYHANIGKTISFSVDFSLEVYGN